MNFAPKCMENGGMDWRDLTRAEKLGTESCSDRQNGTNNSLVWYENLSVPQPGDANRNGVFDTTDLVAIFQAGEYEDKIEGNSTFEEGDFNGDGDFTTADLVVAFTRGDYVALVIS